jgi:hypothetical protein
MKALRWRIGCGCRADVRGKETSLFACGRHPPDDANDIAACLRLFEVLAALAGVPEPAAAPYAGGVLCVN